jgi:hypothetical protein
MPPRDSANRRLTRQTFSDDPRLLFRAPNPPAARTREHLNAPNRLRDSAMLDSKSNGQPSRRLSDQSLTRKVGSKHRSDVRCQGSGRRSSSVLRCGCSADDRAWVEAELKDVGDQALMRGLATAFPIVRPGLFLSYCGRRPVPATKRLTGIPLP